MKPETMCSYASQYARNLSFGARWESKHCYTKRKQKQIRLKCPECKRKVKAWANFDDDGIDPISYVIPPHKRRHWWKKNSNRP